MIYSGMIYHSPTGDSAHVVRVFLPQGVSNVATGVSAKAVPYTVDFQWIYTADIDQLISQTSCHSAY